MYDYDRRASSPTASSMISSLDIVKNEWAHNLASELDKTVRGMLPPGSLGSSLHERSFSPVLQYQSAKHAPVDYAIEIHFEWQGDALKADVYCTWDVGGANKLHRKTFELPSAHGPYSMVTAIGFWIGDITGG